MKHRFMHCNTFRIVCQHVKYSYRVWAPYAYQANTIPETFKKHTNSRSADICVECPELRPTDGVFVLA